MNPLKKIRWRFVIPYVLIILVGMGGLALYLTASIRDAQIDNLRDNLLIASRAAAEVIRPELTGGDRSLDEQARTWSDLIGARVTIIAADGAVLGESDEDRQGMENHLGRIEIREALATGEGSSIRLSATLGLEMLYAAVPIESEGQTLGFMRVAVPISEVEESTGSLQRAIVVAAAVTVLAVVASAAIVAGRMSNLVNRLTQVVQRIAAGDLDARLYYQHPGGELGELTDSFNNMAEQLRDRVNDLDEGRGRLAAMLEKMADGVLITDWLGRVSLINPAAARLLEFSQEEALNRPFAEVIRHHELIEMWQASSDQEKELLATAELDRGGTFVQMIVTPLGKTEQQDRLVILQDLTQIRRLETVRRDFISNISHELRTPLASLKALVETLAHGALEDPPAARRFLDHADLEVDALIQMVEELLELSRIESGMVPLSLSATEVADIVNPPVKRLRRQAERKDLSLAVTLPGDLPSVLADANRARQVVSNLVHNAIKFTPPGGEIEVSARADREESEIVVSVRDSGQGIGTNELGRIFERFYKADRARSGGGTGLGLAIARHIVQAHNGQIWVKSKEGKGSTFYFSLPLADEDA